LVQQAKIAPTTAGHGLVDYAARLGLTWLSI
jgi:hypothetical protein